MKTAALLLAGLTAAMAPAFAPNAAAADGIDASGAEPATADQDRLVYDPAFFAEFAPQSALDMVRRVPGFSLDGGDDRRGFSGTGGNVLIDGERPSSKSQSVFDVLSRIPSGQVARIELLRGGAQNSDAAGQTQVVNVIRHKAGGGAGSGLYSLEFEHTRTNRVSPRGSLSLSGRAGEAEYSFGLDRYLQLRPLAGDRRITDPNGALIASRVDITPRTWRQNRGTALVSTPWLDGKLTVNADVTRWNFKPNLDTFSFSPSDTPTGSVRLSTDDRQRSRGVGADWERSFGDLTLKLIALDTRSWSATDETTSTWDAAGALTEVFTQRRRNDSQESIWRAVLSMPLAPGLTLETGAESAYNALDAKAALARNTGSGFVAVALPGGDIVVEEDRAEAFVRSVWTLDPKWTLEGSLTWESSTISQSGDRRASRELSYWKPSIQAAYSFGEKNQMRVRLAREVGQLDFGDFASSAALADERIAGGNPDIVPDTQWLLEASLDWRWGDAAALSVTAYQRWVQDVVDSVPVAGFDAPGNIGDGEAYGVRLNATVPLEMVAPGARLELEGSLARSEVTDPVTGQTRSFSGFPDARFDISFRQDIAPWKLAWGLEYQGRSEHEVFRLTEREVYREGPFLSAFLETTALPAKIRFFGENLSDPSTRRQRNFYAPTRAEAPSRTELRKRRFGQIFGVEISGKF